MCVALFFCGLQYQSIVVVFGVLAIFKSVININVHKHNHKIKKLEGKFGGVMYL